MPAIMLFCRPWAYSGFGNVEKKSEKPWCRLLWPISYGRGAVGNLLYFVFSADEHLLHEWLLSRWVKEQNDQSGCHISALRGPRWVWLWLFNPSSHPCTWNEINSSFINPNIINKYVQMCFENLPLPKFYNFLNFNSSVVNECYGICYELRPKIVLA